MAMNPTLIRTQVKTDTKMMELRVLGQLLTILLRITIILSWTIVKDNLMPFPAFQDSSLKPSKDSERTSPMI
jgi:hypothetical protein